MHTIWKDAIYRQREELTKILRQPIEQIAKQLTFQWHNQQQLESLLIRNFSMIPYATSLYVLTINGVQVCNNVNCNGLMPGYHGRDRSQRTYMKGIEPGTDFCLSEAYISQTGHRPSLTALQSIRTDNRVVGYLGADFDLRDLPVTAELYCEPENWRQVKGDPAIRGQLFQQTRVESLMDTNLDQALVILEEMLTQRGVFQAQIDFSKSQAIIWMKHDPFRYRLLDSDALADPDICLVYPSQAYPTEAVIPPYNIATILDHFKKLRMADETIYLRRASINLYNGMISVTFSCDGSHYMHYDEFLRKNTKFWFGAAA